MPTDQYFPQTALATDPVAALAGVVPTPRGVRQAPAWRPQAFGVGQAGEARDRWYEDTPPSPATASTAPSATVPGTRPAPAAPSPPAAGSWLARVYQEAAGVYPETGVDPAIVATILSTEGGSTPGSYSLGITTGAPGGRGDSGVVLRGSGIAGQPSAFWGYRNGAEAARALAEYLRTGPPSIRALVPLGMRAPSSTRAGRSRARTTTCPPQANLLARAARRRPRETTTPTG